MNVCYDCRVPERVYLLYRAEWVFLAHIEFDTMLLASGSLVMYRCFITKLEESQHNVLDVSF